ncbi:MAG: hypoxanthine phosphoribosyltransferase [Bacteroidales bacterium]|jgi:hypoxanthine phosphoribosyltransferase|nr:hypoxanthine phosphoribosyltransferase [Bacteroidales bacterium]
MEQVTLGDKTFVKYISEAEIEKEITRIAQEIDNDYKDDTPIFIITLNGAIFFAVELLKKISIDTYLTCIRLSSYEGTSSTEEVKNLIGLKENLSRKRVIVLEDIIDTGNTYEHIIKMLEKENVKDIRIATLAFKPDAYKKNHPIQYIGFSIPNKFVVGYGLDYDGRGRNLRDIYQLEE